MLVTRILERFPQELDREASGGTRKAIVEQLDNLRGVVLPKALGRYPDRPVWTWREHEKFSVMWLCRGGLGTDRSLARQGDRCGPDLQLWWSEAWEGRWREFKGTWRHLWK